MPYPNEHACRIKDPGDFQASSFRRIKAGEKEGAGARDGKQLSIIIGRPKGQDTTTAQSYRYPKDDWTVDQARAHCREQEGTFEAASEQKESTSAIIGDMIFFAEDLLALYSCLVSEVIRKEGKEILLYDSDGEKILNRFPFGKGEKYKDEESAREAAKKREQQIQFFKHQGEVQPEIELSQPSRIAEIEKRLVEVEARVGIGERMATPEPVALDDGTVTLAETASGHIIELVEASAPATGARAPLLMDVVLIQPGWGNTADNHYYPAETLLRDAHVFEGVKMYAADHRPEQKNVKSEVAVVQKIKGFTEDGAPIARVAIHDGDFAEATRNRAALDTLQTLECSILASGRAKSGFEKDGRKGKLVEAITAATAVDWVTRAGAGGHALALAEAERERTTGGDNVTEQANVETTEREPVQEAQAVTIAEQQEAAEAAPPPAVLDGQAVKATLGASGLPGIAIERLALAAWETEEALNEAIVAEKAYVKEITKSGQPFGLGESAAVQQGLTDEEYEVKMRESERRHGIIRDYGGNTT